MEQVKYLRCRELWNLAYSSKKDKYSYINVASSNISRIFVDIVRSEDDLFNTNRNITKTPKVIIEVFNGRIDVQDGRRYDYYAIEEEVETIALATNIDVNYLSEELLRLEVDK